MALSTARLTPQRLDGSFNNLVTLGVKTATTLYVGGIVCTDATGFAVPGATATTLRVMGILDNQPLLSPANSYTNSGANGSLRVQVRQGTFKLANSGTDAVVQADVGLNCYIEDDQTVSHTSTGKSIAGKVIAIDDATSPTGAGVWVSIPQ